MTRTYPDKEGTVRLVEVDMRLTINKEIALTYRSRKLMSQTVSIQRLALLNRHQLNP